MPASANGHRRRAEARRLVFGQRTATCRWELNHVEAVGGLVRRHRKLAVRAERDADKGATRRNQLRLAVEIGQPVQSAATGQRIDHVEDAFVRGEGQPLWPAERREQRANAALPIDAIDVIVRTQRRRADEKLTRRTDGEVKRSYARS